MDTSIAPITAEQSKGVLSISDKAVEKIFSSELELMSNIRSMINASHIANERRNSFKTVRVTQIDMMILGMRRPAEKVSKLVGQRRAAAEITMCENYFMILDMLLDERLGSSKQVIELMQRYWTTVRAEQNINRDSFASTAEQALFLLYRYCYTENIRFSKLHSQAMAHLALVEYRLRNGWLIGKYNGQWTKLQTDSQVIHKWVNEKGTNLTIEAYRFNIGEVHREITGQQATGM